MVLVNGGIEVEDGKFSFSVRLAGRAYVIEGAFQCSQYIEEIYSLETEKYALDGITVKEEHFGTEDKNIVYMFQAEKFRIKR